MKALIQPDPVAMASGMSSTLFHLGAGMNKAFLCAMGSWEAGGWTLVGLGPAHTLWAGP